jgi:GGDEF domain-containing protein
LNVDLGESASAAVRGPARAYTAELREALEELTRVANTDPLTGLLNRRAFEARTTETLASSPPLAFAMFDVDNFKAINDTTVTRRAMSC